MKSARNNKTRKKKVKIRTFFFLKFVFCENKKKTKKQTEKKEIDFGQFELFAILVRLLICTFCYFNYTAIRFEQQHSQIFSFSFCLLPCTRKANVSLSLYCLFASTFIYHYFSFLFQLVCFFLIYLFFAQKRIKKLSHFFIRIYK